ncbi:MAG: hypothetical protein SWK76_06185 [Actinomycetota bacterium]|nr:hypothetical protein [Actinomycetota bacterium]
MISLELKAEKIIIKVGTVVMQAKPDDKVTDRYRSARQGRELEWARKLRTAA